MKEILWLGRGGQGAFTAAKLLGAAFSSKDENNYALAFPSFGPERRGAPVRAFTKLDSRVVSDRSETEKADYIIILDDNLYNESLKNLLKDDGRVIINSKSEYGKSSLSVDADEIAEKFRLPTVNTVMLGVFSAVSGIVSAEDISSAIDGYMPEKIRERNKQAVLAAYEEAVK